MNLQMQTDVKAASYMNYDEKYKLNLKKELKYNRNVFVQFIWLFWRNLVAISRDPVATRMPLGQVFVRLELK